MLHNMLIERPLAALLITAEIPECHAAVAETDQQLPQHLLDLIGVLIQPIEIELSRLGDSLDLSRWNPVSFAVEAIFEDLFHASSRELAHGCILS